MKCPKCGYMPKGEEKEMKLIQKIMSLGFQGKKEEVGKLVDNKISKEDKKVLETVKKINKSKPEKALKLVKTLEKKGRGVKISD